MVAKILFAEIFSHQIVQDEPGRMVAQRVFKKGATDLCVVRCVAREGGTTIAENDQNMNHNILRVG